MMQTPLSKHEPQKKRIFLIDDHPIVRLGLSQLINTSNDLIVCGEASTGREALDLLAPAARTLSFWIFRWKTAMESSSLKTSRLDARIYPVLP